MQNEKKLKKSYQKIIKSPADYTVGLFSFK